MSKARFKGAVVWITGASAGIGRELTRKFAGEGADVAVSGRRVDRLQAVAAEVERQGRQALVVPCDVRQEAEMRQAVAKIVEHFGRLDVAVANAGFGVGGRIENLTADDWHRQLDTNVIGVAMTARYALPELRKTKGRFVLVGSVSGLIAMPGNGAYCASKYAVRAIGQTLSMECRGTGVSVIMIHPGFVASEIAQVDNQGRFDPNRRDPRPARLMWPTDRAAEVMVNAIYRRKREYVFTSHGKVGAFLGQHLPSVAYLAMSRARTRAREA